MNWICIWTLSKIGLIRDLKVAKIDREVRKAEIVPINDLREEKAEAASAYD